MDFGEHLGETSYNHNPIWPDGDRQSRYEVLIMLRREGYVKSLRSSCL